MSLRHIFLAGFLVRIILITYGDWQDENFVVKYTDVDYVVYTDAARQVSLGNSPYDRATYRYSPLLAYAMLPNIWLFGSFGKYLFAFSDLGVGWLIMKVCEMRKVKNLSLWIGLWIFHPLAVNISTRGNADSIACLLILLTIYHQLKGNEVYGAMSYGLAVHFRIFPIFYGPSIVFFYITKYGLRSSIFPLVKFGIYSASIVLLLAGLFYRLYGFVFLYETYLYHFVRRDNRHNFSVYFYDLYLNYGEEAGSMAGFLAFIPQVMVQLSISYSLHRDLPFCFLIQTLALVAFNKVCTSQYFLWYVSIFPIVLPKTSLSCRHGMFLLLLWILGQANWLFWAYKLEFLGENTFFNIWASSISFFIFNLFIIIQLILSHPGKGEFKLE